MPANPLDKRAHTPGGRPRRERLSFVLSAALLLSLLVGPGAAGIALGSTEDASVRSATPTQPPNILLIVTDDQRFDDLRGMSNVKANLTDQGLRFTQAFVPTSLCCPSRTSILTGRYSHSTGVWTNDPPFGSFSAFNDTSTLATWLDPTYETALFGKYLNGYEFSATPTTYVPPGWNTWHVFSNKHGSYYDYIEMISDNGSPPIYEEHGRLSTDYSTTVFADQVDAFLRTSRSEPFFLEFTPFAPHGGEIPEPGDVGTLKDTKVRMRPNFNERNVKDKPFWISSRPQFDERRAARLVQRRRNARETLLAVDRQIGRFIRTLRETDQLQDTVIIFMSDNGKQIGEHRWTWKDTAYEESIRIPLIIRYDQMISGPVENNSALVLNIDIAPTIAELAGVTPGGPVDGQSLVPFFDSHTVPGWRDDFVVEHLGGGIGPHASPSYCGVRSDRWKYVAYAGGEEELYDLKYDPYELQNLGSSRLYTNQKATMLARAKELCSPLPPDPLFTLPS